MVFPLIARLFRYNVWSMQQQDALQDMSEQASIRHPDENSRTPQPRDWSTQRIHIGARCMPCADAQSLHDEPDVSEAIIPRHTVNSVVYAQPANIYRQAYPLINE